jgi:hypothetical protein
MVDIGFSVSHSRATALVSNAMKEPEMSRQFGGRGLKVNEARPKTFVGGGAPRGRPRPCSEPRW